jgi:hypothetical protein
LKAWPECPQWVESRHSVGWSFPSYNPNFDPLATSPFVEAKALFDGEAFVVGRLSAEPERAVFAHIPRNIFWHYATAYHRFSHLCVSGAPARSQEIKQEA